MRIKKKQLSRLKDVLEIDRNEKKDDFLSLLERDLTSVFSEYFDFDKKPICRIERKEGKLLLVVSLEAKDVKIFGVLP